ncbi:hypothetical protein HDU87_003343 [Geranomyces variabilis]|uniref:Transmembrane protein n=1 Tax=Geranomyces variabilis TaxID=109894 RepID=A0AAD5TJY5_9FUNG|nr:hypothetical protein HDU87_003343 [Geranomyces variabilis]
MRTASSRIPAAFAAVTALSATFAGASHAFTQPDVDAFRTGQLPFNFDLTSSEATSQTVSISSLFTATSPQYQICSAPVVDGQSNVWYALCTTPPLASFKLAKITVAANGSVALNAEVAVPGTHNLTLSVGFEGGPFLGLVDAAAGAQVVSLLWSTDDERNRTMNGAFVYDNGQQRVESLTMPIGQTTNFAPIVDSDRKMIYTLTSDADGAPCMMRYNLTSTLPTQFCQTLAIDSLASFALGGNLDADPANQTFYLTGTSASYTNTWANPALQPSNVSTPFTAIRTVPAWSQEIIYAMAPRSVSVYNVTSSGRRERWSQVWKNKLDAGSNDTSVVGLPVRKLVGANVSRGWVYTCVNMTTAPDSGSLVAFRNTSGAIPWTLSANTTTIPCSNHTVLTSADGNSMLVSGAGKLAIYSIADLAAPVGNATASVSLVYTIKAAAAPPTAGVAKRQLPASSTPDFAPVLLERADGSVVALVGDAVVSLPTSASRAAAAPPGATSSTPAATTPATGPAAAAASSSGDTSLSTIAIVFLALLALVFLVLCGLVAWLLGRKFRKTVLQKTTQTSRTSLDPERGAAAVVAKDGSDRQRSASIFSRLAGAHAATHAGSMLNEDYTTNASVEGMVVKKRMSTLDESEDDQPLAAQVGPRRVSLLEEIDAELTPPGTLAAIAESNDDHASVALAEASAEVDAAVAQEDSDLETMRPVSLVTAIPHVAPAAEEEVTVVEEEAFPPISPISVKSDPVPSVATEVKRRTVVPRRPSLDSNYTAPLSSSASTYHTAQSHPEGAASLSSASSSFHTVREQPSSSSSSSDEAWSVDEHLYSPLSDPIEIPQSKAGKKALNRKANFRVSLLSASEEMEKNASSWTDTDAYYSAQSS